LRALLVTQDFLPHLPGGIATYYYHLCRNLGGGLSVLTARLGDTAEFDARQPFAIRRRRVPVVPPEFMRGSGVPALRYPRIAFIALSQWLLFYRHALAMVRRERIGVVIFGHLYLAPLGRRLRRATGVPYGVALHGGELHRYMGIGLVRRAMLAALDAADFLIVNSDFTRSQYLARGVRADQRFVKVNPGVDTSHFRPGAGDPAVVRRRHGLGARPLLISVARLVEWKGHDVVLRALPAVAARVPDVAYLIVGDGPYRTDLERLVRELGLENRVAFAGFVSEGELPSYYAAATALVLPSREVIPGIPIEGFGIVYVEAGACGRPVIGGRGGGTDESIADGVTGFRVDARDSAAVAEAAVRLLSDRELAERMGRAGRERAMAQFDWALQARRLASFLDGVVGAADEVRRGGSGREPVV
jgi:phosphatidylinositol alpha-1,6-mannosyltransferase